mmetsp:Transcript_26665/g.58604  ORF Transcript_26665/g.58604 Transcript_26665/m.58604 type:complete len:434 (+) Transcript_26665:62-1363(+)
MLPNQGNANQRERAFPRGHSSSARWAGVGASAPHGQSRRLKSCLGKKGEAARLAGEAANIRPSREDWPTQEDLVAAVSSLYDDQIKPHLSTLRSRLSEMRPKEQRPRDLHFSCLEELCSKTVQLSFMNDGSDPFILLRDREADFVDVLSPIDVYPAQLWVDAADFFEGPEGAAMEIHGGRYACARTLMALDLPFLRGYTLGQVCHITQLAICQKKILGYLKYSTGAIVPYRRSALVVKITCAEDRCPIASSSSTDQPLPLATWETARRHLREILIKAVHDGSHYVTLSNLKPIFRCVYNLDLSETALGHVKLSELLTDFRFQDLCYVRMQNRSYVVIPSERLLESIGFSSPSPQLESSSCGSYGPCGRTSEGFFNRMPPGLEDMDFDPPGHFFQPSDENLHAFGGAACNSGQPQDARAGVNAGSIVSVTRLSL